MNKLIVLLALAVFLLVASPAVSNVQDPAPESAMTELVMRSRQTEQDDGTASILPLLLALGAVFLVGSIVLYFYFGANWLKQRRLTLKEIRRQRKQGHKPKQPTTPPNTVPPPPSPAQPAQLKRVPEVQRHG